MGQEIASDVPVESHVDRIRWEMNRSWDDSIMACLEAGQWDFATRRIVLQNGSETVPGQTVNSYQDGYLLDPVAVKTQSTEISEYLYGYNLPNDVARIVWVKSDASSLFMINYKIIGSNIFTDYDPTVIEYISNGDDAVNPSKWPHYFMEAVAAHLSFSVVNSFIVSDNGKDKQVNANNMKSALYQYYQRALSSARNIEGVQRYPVTVPRGRYVRSRRGTCYSRRVSAYR